MGKALLAGLRPGEVAKVVDGLNLVATTPKTPIERRLLLRHIAQAREAGYASEQDEFIEGASGVAVPVVFEEGRPLAAEGEAFDRVPVQQAGEPSHVHGGVTTRFRAVVATNICWYACWVNSTMVSRSKRWAA